MALNWYDWYAFDKALKDKPYFLFFINNLKQALRGVVYNGILCTLRHKILVCILV